MAILRSCAQYGVVFAAAFAVGASACAQGVRIGSNDAPARRDGTVRLASYNILNLFDAKDDPSLSGRHDDCHSYDKTVRAKPADQKTAVADAIRRANPDVLGLQEIESYDALIEFREAYLSDMGYKYAVSIDVGQERGIEQAVLSRYPIREARVWPNLPLGGVHPDKYGDKENYNAGKPIEYRRSPLYVKIEVPGDVAGTNEAYELELFVIHHKSGRYNTYWREAEASKLVEMIKEMERENPGRNIAVLGDFNAKPDEASVTVYEQAGMSHVIERDAPNAGLTHESDRAIDFILVSRGLKKEIVPNSAFVLGTPVRAQGADWRTTPQPEGYASDHMPVCVDIVARDK